MPTTDLATLYDTLCTVITATTGRKAWAKAGIQVTPKGPYATVYLPSGDAPATQDVVETVELSTPGPHGETLQEVPWGATHLDPVEVEFFRDNATDATDTALGAATRFRNALQLSARDYDLWQICRLSGQVQLIDMSAIFRADTESRARVRFGLYANINGPAALDANIFDINAQEVDVYRTDTTPPPVAQVNVTNV